MRKASQPIFLPSNIAKECILRLILSLYIYNINGGDVQRKNVVNNVDKSSLWAPWQNGPYKNTQNITKHGVNIIFKI